MPYQLRQRHLSRLPLQEVQFRRAKAQRALLSSEGQQWHAPTRPIQKRPGRRGARNTAYKVRAVKEDPFQERTK